jgi:diaminopropionate ammonia-lyase
MIANTTDHFGKALVETDRRYFDEQAAKKARSFWSAQQNNKETPLHLLPGLAARLGVANIYMKDEGYRLGLGSFKGLGGAYAVISLVLAKVSEQVGYEVSFEDLDRPGIKSITQALTFACATDGNHGRSVAYGAQISGARSVIFVHEAVSENRRDVIAGFGAQVVEVKGTYDDSVLEASRVSDENDWILISDTSWPGYEHIPALVMQGYVTLVAESIDQFKEIPTHVLVQAGVGGIAAAVAAHLKIALQDKCPKIIVVEPERAACFFESVIANGATKIQHTERTVMSMLECYEPSMVAWRVLSRIADAFVTVSDDLAIETMNLLARPVDGDPAIVSGESGGAGLAGLLKMTRNVDLREALGIDQSSIIYVINTEGATDPEMYEQLVGIKPERVAGY